MGSEYNIQTGETTEIDDSVVEISVEQKSEILRQRRNEALSTTDYLFFKYNEQGTTLPQVWVDYRQDLRDLTNDPDFPDVELPQKPTS